MSDTKSADVALLRCDDYENSQLDATIAQAAAIAGFPDVRGATILLKPNVLRASPATKAVTTHPAFVGAVMRFVKAQGAKEVLVGDSPGWQPGVLAAKASGIYDSVLAHGGVWADFGEASPYPIPDGKKLKRIPLTTALKRADLVVNLPKLKNHRLMTYTGAMKNLFGLIPGTAKSAMHLQYPDVVDFGQMLVDLALSVPRCFTFMDGIIAMEGEGPGSGTPYPLGIVLASQRVAMLDWVAARCVGYDPSRIPYLLDGMRRTTGSDSFDEPVTSPLKATEVDHEGFELLPYSSSKVGQRLVSIPQRLRTLAGSFIRLRPIFHAAPCIGCGACIKICPAGALSLEKSPRSNTVHIDDGRCITCFCCHEVCPVGAISVGRAPFRVVHSKMRGTCPPETGPTP